MRKIVVEEKKKSKKIEWWSELNDKIFHVVTNFVTLIVTVLVLTSCVLAVFDALSEPWKLFGYDSSSLTEKSSGKFSLVMLKMVWGFFGFFTCIKLGFSLLNNLSRQILFNLHEATVVQVVRTIYLYGPRYFGWGGKNEADICDKLYQISAEFWSNHPQECRQQINKEVFSYTILLDCIILVYCVWKYLQRSRFWMIPKNAAKTILKHVNPNCKK